MTTAIKSVSVSLDMIKLIEENKISLSEACRVGVAVMLAERGEPQFINRMNIGRKVQRMALMIDDLNKKLWEYENVVSKKQN